MRRFLVALVAATALVGVAAPAATSAGTPTAHAACTKAKIQGQTKCIAAGQYCAKAAERDYRRYGFTCNKRDARGNWHLQYR